MLTNFGGGIPDEDSHGASQEHPFSRGTVLMPWQAGPLEGISGPVFVSVTDFLTTSRSEVQLVYETGLDLGRTWPVMHGAVGLWLWGRPSEFRGGSISVWETEADMRRFVRWPVHAEIVRKWRRRVRIATDSWEAAQFDATQIWARSRDTLEQPHRHAP
ncbi:hypothetical protein [Nocardia sp. CA-135398]|uniref:hypothetical protein n=1 Tax=Nocardia sp. CA-135398 TaxID=3239977 RepID=UPI003D963958